MYKDTIGCRLATGYKAPQYVYGEMDKIEDYYILFSNSKHLKTASVFCDLGSGLGKATLLVAAMFPVTHSIGVEFVPRLHQVALAQKCLFEKVVASKMKNAPVVRFICNDVMKCLEDWLHSDVLYINCVTWKDSVMRRLVKVLERLKPGTEIFTTNSFNSNKMRIAGEFNSRTSWGMKTIMLYVVIK